MATMTKAGRYEILGELGHGAMGVVYRAMDPVIGRTVAVKTIRLTEEGTGLTRPELLTRFQTEARAAGLLTHPNIVVVYDAGEENGLYYITMELVEGKSLQALLDGGHAFSVPRILRILEQTCSALQFAHERNIVHRDIKPANLMLTADDTVKVTDFGTAKILQFGTAQQTSHVMGTPSYMSPEQVKGRPVDGRSDIFSLGVLFYEMLTGEKPFPGQSITAVIYKIVNEDPIPPRQLNPSVHPGLNDIVIRALAKEPEERYQSCREMLEDLRNYRALGLNDRSPDATLISPRPNATLPLGIGGGVRTNYSDDPAMAATVRSLQSRAGGPMQTPVVRRTGPVQPLKEPKKKNTLATVLAALFLLCVIVYGIQRLRPEFQAAQERNKIPKASAAINPVSSASPQVPVRENEPPSVPASTPASSNNATFPSASSEGTAMPTQLTPAAEKKPDAVLASTAQPKRSPSSLTVAATEYKGRIEQALAEQGLNNRVKVNGTGSTLTLSGKLRPAEHATLLRFMRNAPASVRVVDDILYDDTPLPSSEKGENSDNGGHPIPSKGMSAVHIVTDVLGATATLYGPAGRALKDCQTPCSFSNLVPQRYSLQVRKDGYQQVQTALELKQGESQDQKIHLESLANGLYISSRPAGADIFINGAKQSGQTPATLPLAAGHYDLVLRVPGYDPYVGQVQVKDNIQTTLDVELKERTQTHVAWAQVTTFPSGAEIFVDGNPTGQTSPARVQIPSGSHVLAMKLNGYQVTRRGVQASEGGTVNVSETLKTQK
jgi:serine/threonine-protein kinase